MASQMIYKFKKGAHLKGNAQQIGEALEQVRAEKGGLTASTVVESARPKNAPLHRFFEWSDKRAAEEYRKNQARHLIAAIEVRVQEDNGKTTAPVRAFVSIGPSADKYLSVFTVMSDPTNRRKLLAQALSELAAFQKKYESLNELAAVFQAAQQIAA